LFAEQVRSYAPSIRGVFLELSPLKQGGEVYTTFIGDQNFLTGGDQRFYDLVTLERRWSVLTEDIRPSEVAEA